MNDQVTIICYDKSETRNREEAIEFYTEGMMCCEGSERDRYTSIVMGLQAGLKTVDDQWKWQENLPQ